MRAYEKTLSAYAQNALQIITSLPSSRAVEALTALMEGILSEQFWLDPRAQEQIRSEFTNYIYLIEESRGELTNSFVFSRLLWIVKNLLRDGLAVPRKEFAVGIFLEEDESPDELLSKLDLLSKEECPDTKEVSGHKPRRPGIKHKAAERALILALKDRHNSSGQKICPDKREMSGHKLRQGELFQLAA